VCTRNAIDLVVQEEQTLKEFIERLKQDFRLQNPSLEAQSVGGNLYIVKPPSLEEKHRFKLDYTFKRLVEEGFIIKQGEVLEVNDPSLPTILLVKISFK
jgi:E2 binding domain